MQAQQIVSEASRRLTISADIEDSQALLTEWHELFRTGYMAWGKDINNISYPFCHPTQHLIRALEDMSRDPVNPDGYLRHLREMGKPGTLVESYIREALSCYNNGACRAAAVMLGAASEAMILEVRDQAIQCARREGEQLTKKIKDWKIKEVNTALKQYLDSKRPQMPLKLRDEYDAYWSAFTQQIRASRNDAGHPTNIEPITRETAHASFLMFPELAKLAKKLGELLMAE